jgi:hypothetical protein
MTQDHITRRRIGLLRERLIGRSTAPTPIELNQVLELHQTLIETLDILLTLEEDIRQLRASADFHSGRQS